MLKKLEEKVAASTVGTFSEMVQLQNISGVLMKEAARQEKGIFWCQSTRSPGGVFSNYDEATKGRVWSRRANKKEIKRTPYQKATKFRLDWEYIPGSDPRNKTLNREFEARTHYTCILLQEWRGRNATTTRHMAGLNLETAG